MKAFEGEMVITACYHAFAYAVILVKIVIVIIFMLILLGSWISNAVINVVVIVVKCG